MSAPRPYETDPFHPLGSIHNIDQFLYICKRIPVISSIWYVQLCVYDIYACALTEHANEGSEPFFKVILFVLRKMLAPIDKTFMELLFISKEGFKRKVLL